MIPWVRLAAALAALHSAGCTDSAMRELADPVPSAIAKSETIVAAVPAHPLWNNARMLSRAF